MHAVEHFLHETCSRMLAASMYQTCNAVVECSCMHEASSGVVTYIPVSDIQWNVPVSDIQWSNEIFMYQTCNGMVACSCVRHSMK